VLHSTSAETVATLFQRLEMLLSSIIKSPGFFDRAQGTRPDHALTGVIGVPTQFAPTE
jgi:hypothetical protein